MPLNLNSKEIVVEQVGKKSGRFVLFIRCGEKSPLCLKDYVNSDEIIVVISQYQPIEFHRDDNFWIIRGGMSKFDAAHLFFSKFPEMLEFEYFAFFDPDVEISFTALSQLFHAGLKSGKSLYQAAVARDSSTHWEFLKFKNSGNWREVSFIEVMAPFFSKEGLIGVIGGFSDSISTWGLEYHWYSKLKNLSMAVNDNFIMRHDSAVDLNDGPFYRYLATLGVNPFVELKKLKNANVGNRFIECEIPGSIPLFLKKYYVSVFAEYVSRLEKFKYYFSRVLVRIRG